MCLCRISSQFALFQSQFLIQAWPGCQTADFREMQRCGAEEESPAAVLRDRTGPGRPLCLVPRPSRQHAGGRSTNWTSSLVFSEYHPQEMGEARLLLESGETGKAAGPTKLIQSDWKKLAPAADVHVHEETTSSSSTLPLCLM